MENKYDIIANYIETEIYKGNFKSKLPSIRALSIKFNCSNSTVIRAYSELEKKSLIYSMPKSGYFILQNSLFKQADFISDKFDFSSGEPNEAIFPLVQFQKYIDLAINIHGSSLLNYGASDGFFPFKETFCKKHKEEHLNFNEKNVYFSNGAQHSLTLMSLMEFKNKKKSILVESPSYNIYLGWLNLMNYKVYTINRSSSGIDLNVLENLFKNKDIKFFYTIPRLHNPLGTSYDEKTKKQIVYLANKYDVYILEDDYLSELTDDYDKPLKYYDEFDKVIYLKTYSKLLLPGARLATIVLPEEISEDFKQFKTYYELRDNNLFQGALNEYMKSKDYDDYMKNLKNYYKNKMDVLKSVIHENLDINLNFTDPYNGIFSFIQIPYPLNSNDVISALRSKKIYVRNGKYFYHNKPDNKNTIRLSIAKCNEKEIRQGITMLFIVLKDMLKTDNLTKSEILEL